MICFFLFSKESKSVKKCFLFEGVKVREDWLVSVNLFYKESKFKKKTEKKYIIFFYYFFFGGGGGRGASGEGG